MIDHRNEGFQAAATISISWSGQKRTPLETCGTIMEEIGELEDELMPEMRSNGDNRTPLISWKELVDVVVVELIELEEHGREGCWNEKTNMAGRGGIEPGGATALAALENAPEAVIRSVSSITLILFIDFFVLCFVDFLPDFSIF
ncbi:unnamed protein product [Caenorhabditis bovis]|uniref:Uncharacterized protein n=1 Tax=Caenorhabditis bovis TaxID=2654633 RepID=A0A8S1F672_9PELO|nr:unnamed protein product [Caenorhabditis bovis]